MKKLITCLFVLVFASSALAVDYVDILLKDEGDGKLGVYYDPCGAAAPVAYSLTFVLTDGVTIEPADVIYTDPCYPVFIDFVHDALPDPFDPETWTPPAGWDPCDGSVVGSNPLADPDAAGVPAAASSEVSICMGRLSADQIAGPVDETLLLTIQLTDGGAGYTDVTVAEDNLRGGVVGSEFDIVAVYEDGAATRIDFVVAECMKSTAPEYADWVALGRPDCWCYARQCRGDGNNSKGATPFWVNNVDLGAFRLALNKIDPVLPAGGECYDLDHSKGATPFRVNNADLAIFRTYLNKIEPQVPVCDMTNYNFWVTP